MYTIKQAAARTGVSIPLLRAWERRYGVVAPTRTPSGYRLYDEDALTRLRTMRRLVDAGWSPNTAAASILAGTAPLPPRLALGVAAATGAPAGDGDREDLAAARAAVAARSSELRERFVVAAAALDAAGVEDALDEMFARGTFEAAVERDVLPALVDLGEAWAAGRVDVAAEHSASAAIQRRLAAAYQAAARASGADRPVLVGLPPGARHELGALAFAVAARRVGMPIVYLGADLPVGDWVQTARRTAARAAIIGVVAESDRAAAEAVAAALADAVPGIVIAFGGHGAVEPPPAARGASPIRLVLPPGIRDAVAAVASAID